MVDNLDVEENLEQQSSENKGQGKVELDLDLIEDTETPQAQQPQGEKVELDLDDAPFLQEEPQPEAKEEVKKEPETKEEQVEPEETTPFWKNKWLWIGSIILILGLGGGSYFFLSKKEPPSPKESQPKKEEKNQQAQKPPLEEQVVNFDKFIIELQDKNKEAFLEIKLAFATTNGKLVWEIKRKKIVLRDAIYYYLSNKDLTYLSNTKKLEEIKKDLLNVVNQYLNNGQLKKILIEKYIIS